MTRARRCRSSLAAVVGASELIRGMVCCAGRMGSGGRVRRPSPGSAPRVTLGGSSGCGTLAHPGGRGRGARSAPWSRAGSSRHPRGIVRARHVGASGRKGSGGACGALVPSRLLAASLGMVRARRSGAPGMGRRTAIRQAGTRSGFGSLPQSARKEARRGQARRLGAGADMACNWRRPFREPPCA
jgi:hypothetical protein